MPNTPILVTGCQRSGTTLLNLVLDSHPDMHAIDENVFDHADIPSYMHVAELSPYVVFKLPRYASMFRFIQSWPEMRVIWNIRNPYDVVASMLALEVPMSPQGPFVPWVTHPACAQREVFNDWWSYPEDQRQRLMPWMQRLEQIASIEPARRSHDDQVLTAALTWCMKNALPARYDELGIKYHLIAYEKLVENTETEARALLDFIGADWNAQVLEHHRLHDGVSVGNTDNTRAIDNRSVGRGTRDLSAEDRAMIADICGDVATRWGYYPETNTA